MFETRYVDSVALGTLEDQVIGSAWTQAWRVLGRDELVAPIHEGLTVGPLENEQRGGGRPALVIGVDADPQRVSGVDRSKMQQDRLPVGGRPGSGAEPLPGSHMGIA